MNAAIRPHGDLASPTPAPHVCVYTLDGNPLPRLSRADADAICARGWARWAGHGTKRHVRMTVEVPQSPRGGRTTQRIRDDCGTIIAPDFHVEHKPLSNN